MKQTQKLLKMAGALLLCGLLVMLAGCGKPQAETFSQPEIETEPVVEETTLPPVEITMGEYELAYSGSLKDVIRHTELPEGEGLAFTVVVESGEYPIFTMFYNSDQGDLVEIKEDSKGNRIPMAFQMNEKPENISEEEAMTFFAAQEAVNEIVASLTLK